MATRDTKAWIPWVLLAIVLLAVWLAWPQPQALPGFPGVQPAPPHAEAPIPLPPAGASQAPTAVDRTAPLPGFLPPEAVTTIHLIQRGGPYPHRQDGGVFGNRERRLPRKPRGWYREYTVATPGLGHRGARRIVTGGDPPREWYYSDDHYDSFRRFDIPGALP